jgi:hypothetical protein
MSGGGRTMAVDRLLEDSKFDNENGNAIVNGS